MKILVSHGRDPPGGASVKDAEKISQEGGKHTLRNLKRVFSLFLACVMMLGILPTGAFAAGPMRAVFPAAVFPAAVLPAAENRSAPIPDRPRSPAS